MPAGRPEEGGAGKREEQVEDEEEEEEEDEEEEDEEEKEEEEVPAKVADAKEATPAATQQTVQSFAPQQLPANGQGQSRLQVPTLFWLLCSFYEHPWVTIETRRGESNLNS